MDIRLFVQKSLLHKKVVFNKGLCAKLGHP